MGIGCLFFKYRGIDANTLSSLATGKVWFSPRSQLNDPYDCAPNVIWDIDEQQLDELIASFNLSWKNPLSYDDKKKEVEKSLFQHINDCGVFCVSGTPYSPLMWAHYGDSHRGVAISFAVKPENVDNPDAPHKCPRPVSYNGRGRACMFDFYKARLGKTGSDEAFSNLIQACYFSKTPDWAYEQETRFLSVRENGLLELDADISVVVYGARITKEHISLIQRLIPDSVQQYQIKIGMNGLECMSINV